MDYILLSFLPEGFVKFIPSIVLIIIGLVVEKHYVGRITVFSNVCALYYELFWIEGLSSLWTILIAIYANLGLLIAVYALLQYRSKESCPKWVYSLFLLYSSVVVGIIMIILGILYLF